MNKHDKHFKRWEFLSSKMIAWYDSLNAIHYNVHLNHCRSNGSYKRLQKTEMGVQYGAFTPPNPHHWIGHKKLSNGSVLWKTYRNQITPFQDTFVL